TRPPRHRRQRNRQRSAKCRGQRREHPRNPDRPTSPRHECLANRQHESARDQPGPAEQSPRSIAQTQTEEEISCPIVPQKPSVRSAEFIPLHRSNTPSVAEFHTASGGADGEAE